MGGDWETLQEEHTIKTFALTSHKCLESTLDPTPPSSTHLCRSGPCSCRVVCSSSMCTSFEHTCSPIWWNHQSPSPSPSTCWWLISHFWRWFPSSNKGYFRLGGIYLCFGLFTTSFFWWPFRYGVWMFTKLFCPKWFCEWFLTF